MSYGQYSSEHRESIPLRPDLTKKQTPKREKHVFGSGDTSVEHVWATPLQKDGSGYYQTHGTNPQKNFYFKTDEDQTRVLYSYRDSYPIASRFDIGKGKHKRTVYLVRSGKPYSVTTAAHMSAAHNAVPDRDSCFSVPYVIRYDIGNAHYNGKDYPCIGQPDKATHAANLKDIIFRMSEEIARQDKARCSFTMLDAHARAKELGRIAVLYGRIFRVKLPKLPVVPKIDKAKYDRAVALEATASERKKIADAKRAEEWAKENNELLTKWKAGEYVSIYHSIGFALLRVRQADNVEPSGHTLAACVETSQHVTVPVSGKLGAARLLRFLQALKASGRTYQRNGHSEHIGNFTVESFAPAVATATFDNPSEFEWILTAGCHRIKWSEIETVADAIFAAEQAEASTV